MSSKRKTPSKTETAPTFEKALERLEEIIGRIEEEQLDLDEMVDRYEEGMKLLISCRERIQQAKVKIETLEASFDSDRAEVADEPEAGSESAADDSGGRDANDEIRLF